MSTLVNQQNTLFLAASTGEADDLLTQYNARRDLVTGFQDSVESQASTMSSWVATVKTVSDATLGDLQSLLNAPNSRPATILPLLGQYMVANSATILRNVITTPVVTPNGGNNGTGVLKFSVLNSAGITDERIIAETISFVCTSSQWSGGTAGSEQFSITGLPTLNPNNFGVRGNGVGTTLRVSGTGGVLQNGNFEAFTVANQPDSWVVSAGTVGTNVKQNTSNPHSGLSCLELDGDGSTATITLSQNVAQQISATTVYALGVWVRKSGTVTTGSNLQISVQGTGVTTQNALNLDPNTLTTSYQLFTIFFATASTVPPSNYSVQINWTVANSAGASAKILIDDTVLIAPAVFGNVQYVIFRGAADFAVADQIGVVTAVTSAGAFQTFFGRWYNTALPSSASPSIADNLATALP